MSLCSVMSKYTVINLSLKRVCSSEIVPKCVWEREYVRGCATRSDIFDTHWLKYRRAMQHEVISLTSQRQHWQRVAGCSRGLLPVAEGCLSTCWKERQSYSRGILHGFHKKGGSRETGTYSFRIDSRVFVAAASKLLTAHNRRPERQPYVL